MKKYIALLSLLSAVYPLGLQAKNLESTVKAMTLKELGYKAIEYALKDQKSSPDKFYLSGEWPTKIQSTMVPALVGVGRMIGRETEATGFTTAAVISVLAQTYLENENIKKEFPLNEIPRAILQGTLTFPRYLAGPTYNFYPELLHKGVMVRRPIDMTLFPLWHGFTNIPNDSDTTSSVVSALTFNAIIQGEDFNIQDETIKEFTKFRDINRKAMFYNRTNNLKDSGGFLTWLYDENNPSMPRFYFSSSTKGERIPFNRNDVDCIVNANILKMLAMNKKTNAPGYADSCRMLNDLIENDEHKNCGVYYPNTLNLSFALASAEKAGVTCITDRSHALIIDKIISMQRADGLWHNEGNIWKDPTLTTAFALYSLLHYGKSREDRIHNALVYGVHALLKLTRLEKNEIFWDADHFFTATALARSLIMWRSKAYTNAIIGASFLKMQQEFPHYTVDQYLKLKFGSAP